VGRNPILHMILPWITRVINEAKGLVLCYDSPFQVTTVLGRLM